MPSPFPGMDPYLEGPYLFPDFHDSMIIYMKAVLQGVLPANYFALSGERVWVEASDRNVIPDVTVTKILSPRRRDDDGGVALLEPETDTAVVIDYEYEREPEREIFLDIFSLHGPDRELVTSIEILSPTNKTPGKGGRDMYRAKQSEMLAAQVHLIEIDLLREGKHTTAVPREQIEHRFGSFDYHVCLHRCDDPQRFRVYPIRLREKLPVITVPLKTADGYVELDLQTVFTRCYDESGYAKAIAYGRDLVTPPLSDEQAAWAKALLEQAAAPKTLSP